MNYDLFIKEVHEQLVKVGWTITERPDKRIEFAVTRDETTTIVTTKRGIAFLNGDRLSKDDIKEVLDSVHKARKGAAMPPLFPVTNILVFVFEHANNTDWICKNAKKRDLLATNYTVSWVVDLTRMRLEKHAGLPMISSGESEIEAVLSNSTG
jgi:hypothetical protein